MGNASKKKLRIMTVDDQRTQLLFEQSLLGKERFEFSEASNGREAIEKAKREIPDLILLDIMMPGMDGLETIQALRKEPATRSIPVIMVTTKSDLEYMERAYEHGCNDYITKPIRRVELIEKIRTLTGFDPT